MKSLDYRSNVEQEERDAVQCEGAEDTEFT